ncbi:MFS transporter [Vibrio sp. PP-XX7]
MGVWGRNLWNKLAGFGYMKLALTGMLMLMIGCLAMVLAMSLQFVSLMAVSLVLIGLGMGFTATTTLVFVQNSAPDNRIGSWTSTVQFLRNMGAAIGVNALANVQMLTGNNFQICFLVLAGIMIPGVIAAIGLPKTYTHRA